MDLGKIMLIIASFALGLTIAGVLPLWAFFIGGCVLFSGYFLSTAIFNAVDRFCQTLFDQQQKEQEEERTIGFPQSLLDVNEDNKNI